MLLLATVDFRHSHGMPPLAFHRAQLIRCLFDGLPQQSKAKIFTAKQIVNIETLGNGVVVSCNDGTSYDGSIVIGADGAHSTIRKLSGLTFLGEQTPRDLMVLSDIKVKSDLNQRVRLSIPLLCLSLNVM